MNRNVNETMLELFKQHHYECVKTSYARGYVSRKYNADGSLGYIESYKGKYGEGFKLHLPAWHTTNYHYVSYYIKKEPRCKTA